MFAIRLADSLFIISLFFSLVKCFFQISLNFFCSTFFQKEKTIYKFLLCQTQLPLQASRAAPAVLRQYTSFYCVKLNFPYKPPVLRQQSYRSARLVSSDSNVIISSYSHFVNSKFIRGFFLFLLSFYNYPILY